MTRLRPVARDARLRAVERWDLRAAADKPHNPEILYSGGEGRAILLDLPAGQELQEHQVHEGAWIAIVDGEVEITDADGESLEARPGILVHVSASERHEVRARGDARLLLLLSPWPGAGHPGAMTLEEKAGVRARAKERAG
jgi:quercetin dioxygenase-like cupin family protein